MILNKNKLYAKFELASRYRDNSKLNWLGRHFCQKIENADQYDNVTNLKLNEKI